MHLSTFSGELIELAASLATKKMMLLQLLVEMVVCPKS